jgi:formate hydrogenlyase subunit 3/multisubunit Na+/H+ antiporter MnhD subunit
MTGDESLREKYDRYKQTAAGAYNGFLESDRAILGEVRMIAGGLVMVLIITLVLTEVYNAVNFETDANGNYTGPFGDVVAALESTGVAAMTLLVVGFLVVAAGAIMRYFNVGFGGGR